MFAILILKSEIKIQKNEPTPSFQQKQVTERDNVTYNVLLLQEKNFFIKMIITTVRKPYFALYFGEMNFISRLKPNVPCIQCMSHDSDV